LYVILYKFEMKIFSEFVLVLVRFWSEPLRVWSELLRTAQNLNRTGWNLIRSDQIWWETVKYCYHPPPSLAQNWVGGFSHPPQLSVPDRGHFHPPPFLPRSKHKTEGFHAHHYHPSCKSRDRGHLCPPLGSGREGNSSSLVHSHFNGKTQPSCPLDHLHFGTRRVGSPSCPSFVSI